MLILFNIGSRIRELREGNNWTQEELAIRAGIQRSSISRIENNAMFPSIPVLVRIANAFDLSLSGFFCKEREYISDEMETLIQNVRELTPEQIKMLNQFLESIVKK